MSSSDTENDQKLNDDIYLTPDQLLWIDSISEAIDEYIHGTGDVYEEAERFIFGEFNGFSIFDHIFDSIFCSHRYKYLDPSIAKEALCRRRIDNQKRLSRHGSKHGSTHGSMHESEHGSTHGRKHGKNKNGDGRGNRNSVTDDTDRNTGNFVNDEEEPGIKFILFDASN